MPTLSEVPLNYKTKNLKARKSRRCGACSWRQAFPVFPWPCWRSLSASDPTHERSARVMTWMGWHPMESPKLLTLDIPLQIISNQQLGRWYPPLKYPQYPFKYPPSNTMIWLVISPIKSKVSTEKCGFHGNITNQIMVFIGFWPCFWRWNYHPLQVCLQHREDQVVNPKTWKTTCKTRTIINSYLRIYIYMCVYIYYVYII